LAKKACQRAANDNGDAPWAEATFDSVMRLSLKHFATHGLGAARMAREEAEQAHDAGDAEAYTWWLDVCRTLDRPMAQSLDRKLGYAAALIY
jgi:hypothetical protein